MSSLRRTCLEVWTALMLAACGSPTPASEPAPAEPTSGASEPIAEEAPPPPPSFPGDDELSERVRARIAELGASGRLAEGGEAGLGESELTLGGATLRVAAPYQALRGLDALAALAALRSAGVAWLEITRVRGSDVWLSEAVAVADPARLTTPSWLLPPSRRRRARGATPAPGAATRTIEGIALDVDAVRVDATTSVMLLGISHGEAPEGSALCVVHADEARCAPTELVGLDGLASPWSGAPWAFVASGPVGGSRDSSRVLVFVAETEGRVTIEQLVLGGSAGDGEACEGADGYCVSITASASDARWVADRCLEIDAPTGWTAEHVRVGDRWRGESITRAARCVRRYEIGPLAPLRSRCGPEGGRPECPEPSE